jgi:hypothetical protein
MDQDTQKFLEHTRTISPPEHEPVSFDPATLLDKVRREILTPEGYRLLLEYEARVKTEEKK